MTSIIPIRLNFKNIRINRQKNNNNIVYESIKTNDLKTFDKSINNDELKRKLLDIECTKEELILECQNNDLICKIISSTISKKSTRQCTKDETQQINICNSIAEKCGILIKNLNVKELRPTKDGKIINEIEMKNLNIKKDNCLKSFDAKISGNISGYITAKVVYGNGGHQDNVFDEMDNIAEWWKKYKKNVNEILVILIDTDLYNKFIRLKHKYKEVENVIINDHYDFQQYIIDKYYYNSSVNI